MKRVFISNTRMQEDTGANIITDDAFDVANFPVPDTTGGTVYIIDVHSTFPYGGQGGRRRLKAQEQGGVIIYRHLLEHFKGNQDKLKVIFYSPLTARHLTSLKPDNYVLNLLPFVELFPADQGVNHTAGWTFEAALQAKISENNFPQFNNASENLLSGWAWSGANKIDLKGKKLLVIDDEWEQWQAVYRVMFSGSVDYFLKDTADIKAEFKKLDDNTFPHLMRGSLAQYDLIISDLYLWENHETDKWKTEDFINSISGFLLLKLIRDIEPAIPVIFHTTSTKFRIYETLSALGSDGQVPKNVSSKPWLADKIDTYQLFLRAVANTTDNYSGCWLNEFYRFVSDDKGNCGTWWRKRLINEPVKTKEVKDLIRHAILGYKNLMVHYGGRERKYLKAFFSGNEIDPVAMSASGIINNLGKIKEVINDRNNPELQFISKLRDQGSHATNYHLYRLDDVKIILVLLFQTLKVGTKRVIIRGEEFNAPSPSHGPIHKYKHQLLYYVHYHNTWRSFIPKELLATFRARVSYYVGKYYSERWKYFNLSDKKAVTSQFQSIKIDTSISSILKEEVINQKLVITFRQ